MFANKNLVKKDKDAARIVLFIIRREILNILNEAETVPRIQEEMNNLLNKEIDDFDKPKEIKDSEIKSWKDKTVDEALKEFGEAYKSKTDDTSTAAKSITAFVEVATKIPDSVEEVERLYEALELKPVDNKHSLLDKRKWEKKQLALNGETYSQAKDNIEKLKKDKKTGLSGKNNQQLNDKNNVSKRKSPEGEKGFRTKTGDVSNKNNDSESTQKIDAQKRNDPQENETKIADSRNSDSSGRESKSNQRVDTESFFKELNKTLANGPAPKLEKMAKSGVQKENDASVKAASASPDLPSNIGEQQGMLEKNNELRNSMRDVIRQIQMTSNEQDGNSETQETRGEKNQGKENKDGTAEIDRNEKVARTEITQTAPDTGKMSRQQKKQLKKQKEEEAKERRKEEKKTRRGKTPKKEKKRKKTKKIK